jgi:hypothetical protein
MNNNIPERLTTALSKYPMTSQSESSDPIVIATWKQVNWWEYFIYEYNVENNIAFWYVMWDFSEFWTVDVKEQIDVAWLYNHDMWFKIISKPLSEISDFTSIT